MSSCNNRDRSFSVETTISSEGARSLLVNSLGNWSLAAKRASIHEALSSLDTQRRWRVFVPVNMVNLLSSDLLARTEETCREIHYCLVGTQMGKQRQIYTFNRHATSVQDDSISRITMVNQHLLTNSRKTNTHRSYKSNLETIIALS